MEDRSLKMEVYTGHKKYFADFNNFLLPASSLLTY